MKTVVVTGATSGIGLAVCDALLKNGCRVVGIGRSPDRCALARKKLLEETPDGDAVFLSADLMHLGEVRRVAGEGARRARARQ
jgi:NAD(P)-dependent dehydrogenase (short-subunit alcohol dehydrogenase family)